MSRFCTTYVVSHVMMIVLLPSLALCDLALYSRRRRKLSAEKQRQKQRLCMADEPLTGRCQGTVGTPLELCRSPVGALSEPCRRAVGTLVERCRNSVGTLLGFCRNPVGVLSEPCRGSVGTLSESCRNPEGLMWEKKFI